MFGPLRLVLEQIVRRGDFRLIDCRGRVHRFGDGSGVAVVARLTDRRTERALVHNPTLVLGEAYMDGRFVVERGTIYDVLDLLVAGIQQNGWPVWAAPFARLRRLGKRLQQFNPVPRAKRNAAHHYDIERRIYELFLDPDMQYSCAYFEHPGQSLDEAQLAKKRHLAAKLRLAEGQKVLDIGSGWGGLSLYLAQRCGVQVAGVTLSEEQLRLSRKRANMLGLGHVVRFELQDYRQVTGRFDRIVSVGMFEHVGITHYRTFFDKIASLLPDDGIAVLHSIGRFDGPATTNPFIAKYIFPGGYIPALSEVVPAVEKSGLLITDIEILRLHYAETLRHWRTRFLDGWAAAAALKGERFCRMWEFYLAGSETAFRHENLMVFQIQLARNQSALPLTRAYMHEEEARLRGRDRAIAEAPRLAGE